MTRYIEANLAPNEELIMEAKKNFLCILPKILAMAIGVLIAVLPFILNSSFPSLSESFGMSSEEFSSSILLPVSIPFIVIGLVIIIKNIAKILSIINTNLAVTNKRVLGKIGVLSIKALDYPIEKIDNISLSAGMWGRIFRYYTLSVKNTGSELTKAKKGASGGINFHGIKNAIEFKNNVTVAIEQHSEDGRKLLAEEIANAIARKQLILGSSDNYKPSEPKINAFQTSIIPESDKTAFQAAMTPINTEPSALETDIEPNENDSSSESSL